MIAEILMRLRSRGWTVAVHNDYKLGEQSCTFWLFTHQSGVWAKGEGATDDAALLEAEAQATRREREGRLGGGPLGQFYDFMVAWREQKDPGFTVQARMRFLDEADALGKTLDAMDRRARP